MTISQSENVRERVLDQIHVQYDEGIPICGGEFKINYFLANTMVTEAMRIRFGATTR